MATPRPRLCQDQVNITTRPCNDSTDFLPDSIVFEPETVAHSRRTGIPACLLSSPINLAEDRRERLSYPTIVTLRRTNESRFIGHRRAPRRRRTHLRWHALENGPARVQNGNSRLDRRGNGHARYPGDPRQRSRQSRQASLRQVARHPRRAGFRRTALPSTQTAPRRHDSPTPPQDRYPDVLGSPSSRPLPRLDARL